MKQLSKLKSNQLAQRFLTEQEMNILLGGGSPGDCCCGCNGPSSTSDNDSANNAGGKHSSGCSGGSGGDTNEYINPANCWCWSVDCYSGGK